MSETNPYDPPPQEEPTHDVPVFPEEDPPQGTESPIRASAGPGEHDVPDEGDDDSTATSVNINQLGTFFCHGSERNRSFFQICFLERSPILAGDRISIGSDGRNTRLRV